MDNVYRVVPPQLTAELLRLARKDRDWCALVPLDGRSYRVDWREYSTFFEECSDGCDFAGMLALSRWLVDGPKIAVPTAEQQEALAQVEVNLELYELVQPFPAVLVELSGRFTSCLCFRYREDFAVYCLASADHRDDIVTAVQQRDGEAVEVTLNRYDEDCSSTAEEACAAIRVAINYCMLLTGQCSVAPARPAEVERDKRLAAGGGERGQRATGRLTVALHQLTIDQHVVLSRSEGRSDGTSGREVRSHWRRGHWHTVVCGEGRTGRRRVLYPPVLVREDLFLGERSDTKYELRG
jgi:hypothetical protein